MAEIIYADGRTETVDAPKDTTAIRAPTKFETYRSARQRGTERALGVVPLPQGAAGTFAEMLTPQTPAEQGIEAGLAVMGPVGKSVGAARPIVARGARYATPAVAGAVGDVLGRGLEVGHNLWEGARGGAYALAGDLIPAAVSLVGRKKAIQRADEKSVGRAVNAAVPAMGGATTARELEDLGVGRQGLDALARYRQRMTERIDTALSGQSVGPGVGHPTLSPGVPRATGHTSIEVPALRQPGLAPESGMPFTEALGWLSKLSDKGWINDRVAQGADASAMRKIREEARAQIVAQLNERVPGLGAIFDKGMNQLAKGHLFQNLLAEPGVIAEGKLNMNGLREALRKTADGAETYRQRLEKLASPEEVKRFYDAVTRKSGDLTARDIAGSLGLGVHFGASGPHVWAGVPHPPRYVGKTPEFTMTGGGTPLAYFAQALTRENPEPLE